MTDADLIEAIRAVVRAEPPRAKSGAALRRAVERAAGWRRGRRGETDDWYRRWEPWLARVLVEEYARCP